VKAFLLFRFARVKTVFELVDLLGEYLSSGTVFDLDSSEKLN